MMSSTKRLRCAACLRPGATCLCDVAAPVAHQAEVLILQHPLESSHAKGTARLLHLCLPRSRLEVGEVFDVESLQSWLTAPWHGAAPNTPPGIGPRTVLLYPPSPPDPALPLIASPPYPPHGWPATPPRCGWWCWTAPGARAARCSSATRFCSNCRVCRCPTCPHPATAFAARTRRTSYRRWKPPAPRWRMSKRMQTAMRLC